MQRHIIGSQFTEPRAQETLCLLLLVQQLHRLVLPHIELDAATDVLAIADATLAEIVARIGAADLELVLIGVATEEVQSHLLGAERS